MFLKDLIASFKYLMKIFKIYFIYFLSFEYLTIRSSVSQVPGLDFAHVCHELLYFVTKKLKNRTLDVKETNFQQARRRSGEL